MEQTSRTSRTRMLQFLVAVTAAFVVLGLALVVPGNRQPATSAPGAAVAVTDATAGAAWQWPSVPADAEPDATYTYY